VDVEASNGWKLAANPLPQKKFVVVKNAATQARFLNLGRRKSDIPVYRAA